MKVPSILSFLVGVIMVGGFLVQMWDLFGQFLSGLKTVAVSFEKRKTMEFPSFAFCDSRAVRSRMSTTANAAQYNATTFNLKDEITLHTFGDIDTIDKWGNDYVSKLVPTILNGYCMLYEFYRDYPVNTIAGELDVLIYYKRCLLLFSTTNFSILYACK